MKIVVGLIAIGIGVWCIAENRRLAGRQADVRSRKLLSWKASVRVYRALNVFGGLYLILTGIALIAVGWKEFE